MRSCEISPTGCPRDKNKGEVTLCLWLNYGAWSGSGSQPHFKLGLEPSTAAFDSLAVACKKKAADILEPGETRVAGIVSWSISSPLLISIGSQSSP